MHATQRICWWQSIRWRLPLGSVLVMLLAVSLLMLAALGAIVYYYEGDQSYRMGELASSGAQQIGTEYIDLLSSNAANAKPSMVLLKSAGLLRSTLDQQYVMAVLDLHSDIPLFPPLRLAHSPALQATRVAALVHYLGLDQKAGDLFKIRQAIASARLGVASSGEFGKSWLPQPFVVRPIFADGKSNGAVIGVLFMTLQSAIEKTLPLFIVQVGSVVLLASLLVAIIAAGAATLFARTITHPLARLTAATRKMAAGDYHAYVQRGGQGELGELAMTFNEMAAQLHRDVEELRKQECWRRELIMNITHDLATPLTAIAGLGEALADGVNQSQEDYASTGRIIVRETLRLCRLVRDLHMMARVETGALHPQRQVVRLATLADETLAVLVPEFERAMVEPHNLLSYHLPLVQADPDMLSRVFANLCTNALQHTPAGGTITLQAEQAGDVIQVAITDTGEGIPPEALPRIFERFYRADTARRSTTGGSGLGLAIVRAIVEAHGGEARAENHSEGGARIIFTLPLQPAGHISFSHVPTPRLFQSLT
ncbi:MAG TPA: HAMP domain-containing sensor histidine kinase [Ktedonosporobacter sp.]|nr:HAMP domain-containing sensor histidine kinase [Ktedonosporobacter sp.]